MVTDSEKAVLNQVYKSSKSNLDAIHAVISKVYDDDLSLDLNRQAARYSRLEEQAENKLREKGIRPEKPTPAEKAKQWGTIQANTLMNTSTQHIANMMIRENTEGMVDLMKAVKHNPAATKESCEMAEELMDFEEKSIQKLKSYLKK